MIVRYFCLCLLMLSSLLHASGQVVPELPRAYIDTSYYHPNGATALVAAGEDLQDAIDAAKPGDTIVLEAGATFTGNFTLPPKTGNGWIYIVSSALDRMAHPGQRTSPAEASFMPKIQSPNTAAAISVLPGARNYRLAGLEIMPAKGAPRVFQLVYIDFNASRVAAKIHSLAESVAPGLLPPDEFPKNIVLDRCYIHGSDTQDVREGVAANGISVAVVDSHISDIHDSTNDSQAVIAYRTPGPLKIVNNFLSATTEDVMFGGAGGKTNKYVPSDIEIRRNHLFKPLEWEAPGVTVPPHIRWAVKNNLEFKNAQRVLVSGNLLENNWLSAQTGYSVLFTVRTSQSGNLAVVDDITFENNILKNVDAGFSTLATDNLCGAQYGYPDCSNSGETKRIKIANNLVLLSPKNNGSHHAGLLVSVNLTDLLFQHNSVLMSDQSPCWNSIFFSSKQSWRWPPPQSYTHNLWILDNVLCRPPTGDWGGQGTAGLTYYMGDPPPLDQRFKGNLMLVGGLQAPAGFPPKNALKMKFNFADSAAMNYQLVSPKWTQASDELPPGVDMAKLLAAQNSEAGPQPILQPQVAMLGPGQTTQFISPSAASSWELNPRVGSITAQGLYIAPQKIAKPAGVTVCAVVSDREPSCASIVLRRHESSGKSLPRN